MRKKKGDKREAIFEATLQLITERGFHDTPTSLIAKEAGIATGTLYLYFESKERLLNQLYFKVKKHMVEGLTEGLSPKLFSEYSSSATLQKRLELVWHNGLNHFLAYPVEFAFIEQFENSPLLDQATLEASGALFQPLYALYTEARTQKIIKDIPGDLTISLFFSPMQHFVKQHIRLNRSVDEETIAILFQGCWDAIKR